MKYLLEEQVQDCERDLADYMETFQIVSDEIERSKAFRDKVFGWIKREEQRLEALKEEVKLEANRITQHYD